MTNAVISEKISRLRTEHGLSQQQLALALGWNHHQTVSEVEQGHRDIKATELANIANFFSKSVTFFLSDEKISEPIFISYGSEFSSEKVSNECAAYQEIEKLVFNHKNLPSTLPRINLRLNKWQQEEAYQLGAEMRFRFNLGSFPALSLISCLEEHASVRFLTEKVSGTAISACSRTENHSFIWINQVQELYLTIARELFHLLTFDTALHESIKNNPKLRDKNELLADAFAVGLLVPEEQLRSELSRLNQRLQLSDVVLIANLFHVTPEAILHRLHNLKIINKPLYDAYIDRVKKLEVAVVPPARDLSRRYISLVYTAYQYGKISRIDAAEYLGVKKEQLKDYLLDRGFPIFTRK